ncbi:tetratricopeptide repeat-containing sulfotransferase family protein [Sphingomonas gei]|uniref:tetratricopeptide repeat-containing sulfotransferase family protein n=1 Tax=Sphingomonas gei TaxID=1395960 RepID=UPI001F10EF91|nr:tetratricopeptide repeat-containing sulfotransferase family protein [Sphingomonas gei]
MIEKQIIAGSACPCASGLGRHHCCELDLAQVQIVPPERHAEALAALTRAYHGGARETARRLALEILEMSPGQREALGALFNLLRDAGQAQAATSAIVRLARLFPNDAAIRSVAAGFFLQRHDLPQAYAHGRMLVRLAPEESVAHFLMGRIFLARGKAQAAEFHLQSAEQLAEPGKRDAPDLQAARAVALREQSKFGEARAIYERISAAEQLSVQMLLDWAALEEAARDFAAAFALLDRAEATRSGDPRVAVMRAGLHRRVQEPERALDAIDTSVTEGQPATLLSKGQILDSLGRYDEAFACFDLYKARLREGGARYLADEANQLVTALTDFFTEGRARLLPRAAVRQESAQPIFIVGFPRSGTTLVEQTLSSHPQISAGDELPIIGSIAQRAQLLLGSPGGYPSALSELWLGDRRGHVDTLRDLYLNEAHEMGVVVAGKRWFTDKMPLNETHLGLISLLFPQSPIIHLVRHPLDVVLSVFSNALTHGFYCASALESAATHYARIADLIAHYRSVMPLRYHAVRYEDLVTDQEREVRAMLDGIGEPFDPAMLAFHHNARHARTASYAQVTEKLYTRSRFRYRNYLKHLEPVIPILQPAIERLGYSIES